MSIIDSVALALRNASFAYSSEVELHRGIDQALRAAKIPFTPEVRLNDRDRIDYLIGTVGVEVKIKGSVDALRRQLTRYSEHEQITELLVITTVRRHLQLPTWIGNKPATVIALGRLS